MTNKTVRLPVVITAFPYLQDHRFAGSAVLPAVEAMDVLAQSVKEFAPVADITASTDTTFDKFLFIPPTTKKIDALCSITTYEKGDIIAVLQTKTRLKNSGITRVKEHVTVQYPHIKPEAAAYPYPHNPLLFGKSGCLEISPDRIYHELVPFGPAYQNISKNLFIHKDGAVANLRAPIFGDAVEKTGPLGSPFVLDAAFHTACVWGQRYNGVVAFPVGVEKRIVVKPTQPGDTYISTATPVRTDSEVLVFDICIYDEENTLFEIALGVQMRDVSGRQMKPPEWIMESRGKI